MGRAVVELLNDRETDIALRKAEGATCAEIGDALGLTAGTVEQYWQTAKQKTGLRSVPLVVQVVIYSSRGVEQG
jgi:DNA-binding CsgD family transcriptional regulator